MKAYKSSDLTHKRAEVMREAEKNGVIIQECRTNGDVVQEFTLTSKTPLLKLSDGSEIDTSNVDGDHVIQIDINAGPKI